MDVAMQELSPIQCRKLILYLVLLKRENISMSKFYYNEEQASYDAIVVGSGISGVGQPRNSVKMG